MDTITHGIAGALLGKALFGGDEMFSTRPMNTRRIITWSLITGAIFPDIDVVRDIFSHNDLLMITWHRSITHSLLCLPIFALLLAALTRAICRRLGWEAPSFALLTGSYAAGILSHILLDLVTTFGTMIWSPLEYSRPAWDLIFIVDFTLAGLLLLPQLLAWIYAPGGQRKLRAISIWAISELAVMAVTSVAQYVGAPISAQNVAIVSLLVTTAIFLPSKSGLGARVSMAGWNRAGFAASCAYLLLAVYAHHVALERIKSFAAFEKLSVESIGALPLPPSLLRWDGLVSTSRGVYEWRMDLTQKSAILAEPKNGQPSAAAAKPANDAAAQPTLEYRFYPSAFRNLYTDKARQLPEVQKVLWFSRFPVTRFHQEGDDAVVEISDKRFPQVRPGRPSAFTYRVRFGAQGQVVSQGWEK
jgi:membrane-bound metal-dependent hydrolase YbcI (DUF457 family)